jgi:hypothetical protein
VCALVGAQKGDLVGQVGTGGSDLECVPRLRWVLGGFGGFSVRSVGFCECVLLVERTLGGSVFSGGSGGTGSQVGRNALRK